jgi:hypothetical protein
MVYFQTKNPNLGKFWRALEWKILVYFMTIWNILLQLGISYALLVQFVVIWYCFSNLVCLDQLQSGDPGLDLRQILENGVFSELEIYKKMFACT